MDAGLGARERLHDVGAAAFSPVLQHYARQRVRFHVLLGDALQPQPFMYPMLALRTSGSRSQTSAMAFAELCVK